MKRLHAGGEAASLGSSTEESSCANLPHVESVIGSAASKLSKMSPAYMREPLEECRTAQVNTGIRHGLTENQIRLDQGYLSRSSF